MPHAAEANGGNGGKGAHAVETRETTKNAHDQIAYSERQIGALRETNGSSDCETRTNEKAVIDGKTKEMDAEWQKNELSIFLL